MTGKREYSLRISGLVAAVAVLLGLTAIALGAPDVRMASSGSETPIVKPLNPPEDPPIPTDKWAVRLAPDTDPDELASRLGAENLGQIGSLADTYLFRFSDSELADRLRVAPQVWWSERQFARQQSLRRIPTDPLYLDQWHLSNVGQSGGTPGQDIDVVSVWSAGYFGTGVVIGLVDDGLQYTHSDLVANYVASASYDFNDNDSDPMPYAGDGHGTAGAGVAAARDDGSTCGVGAAYRAGLAGLRLIAGPTTDADEAAALTHHYDSIHIFSNSWGPKDDGLRLEGPGPLTLTALKDGVTNGRNGLGNIYVWAAGNGRSHSDNVNFDGYANSRFTIAVGAIDHTGVQAWYSEPGAAVLVTAPSSGDNIGIVTTDLLGADGASSSDCTSSFGGTSSAASLVSGVVALMLQANPDLNWRDVQHILVETAVQNDPTDSDWTPNGAGHLINHKYGFGRVDTQAAVSAARNWANVAGATRVSSGIINVDQPIPDNSAAGVTSRFSVDENIILEHVEVVFDATHTSRGDLEIVLTSPSGTQSVLAERHPDSGDNYNVWKFVTVRNWGESSAGPWTLKVADRWATDTGTFDSWALILHGRPISPSSSTPTPTVSNTPVPAATATPTATPTPTVMRINLARNWNLISLPFVPSEGAAERVALSGAGLPPDEALASIAGSYDRLYAFNACNPADPWQLFDPDAPEFVNDLDRVDETMGLWITMNTADTLTIAGIQPATTEIPLCAGWNLIGYPAPASRPVEEVLASIEGEYERVYAFDAGDMDDPWKLYDPSVPNFVCDLTEFRPGLGYWIKLKNSVEQTTLTIEH